MKNNLWGFREKHTPASHTHAHTLFVQPDIALITLEMVLLYLAAAVWAVFTSHAYIHAGFSDEPYAVCESLRRAQYDEYLTQRSYVAENILRCLERRGVFSFQCNLGAIQLKSRRNREMPK